MAVSAARGGTGGSGGNITVVVGHGLNAGSTLTCLAAPGATGERGKHGAAGEFGDLGANCHSTMGISEFAVSGESRFNALLASGKPLPAELTTLPGKWGRSLILLHADSIDKKAKGYLPGNMKGVTGISYLHKLMETARIRYLQWDAYRFAEDKAAEKFKEELAARLEFLMLAQALLPQFLPEYDKPMAAAISVALAGLTTHFAKGLD